MDPKPLVSYIADIIVSRGHNCILLIFIAWFSVVQSMIRGIEKTSIDKYFVSALNKVYKKL